MKPIIHLLEEQSKINSSEGRLAKYLLNYKGDILSLKTLEASNNSYVSLSTTTRLAKAIGLSGFVELRFLLANEREEITAFQHINHNLFVEEYIKENNKALKETYEQFDYQLIKELALAIDKMQNISFIAYGSSNIRAMDFEYKLHKLGIMTNSSLDLHQQALFCTQATKNQLILIISYSGENKEIIDLANIALENNANCFIISSNEEAFNSEIPLIKVHYSEPLSRYFSTTSTASINFILDLVFLELLHIDPVKYEQKLAKNLY